METAVDRNEVLRSREECEVIFFTEVLRVVVNNDTVGNVTVTPESRSPCLSRVSRHVLARSVPAAASAAATAPRHDSSAAA